MLIKVAIEETLSKVIEVDAQDEKEALKKVEDAYWKNEYPVLTSDDYVLTTFTIEPDVLPLDDKEE